MNKYSTAALLICYLLMSFVAFQFYPKWEKTQSEATLSWDASGYYMYLPALFIYEDLKKCAFQDSILQHYRPTPDFTHQAIIHPASGNFVMKYAAGQAIMMSPFFALGHFWARNSAYPPDGFSYPYQMSIGVGMFLYALLGLWLLRKVLLLYFSDKTTAITLLLLVFGTNYLNYSSIDQALTHNTLFTVYVLIWWFSARFHQKPSVGKAFLVGIFCGLAMLIRPTELIAVLIPLLYGVSDWAAMKARGQFILAHFGKVLTFALAMIAVGSVQLFYWKYVSGDWLVYSYAEQGFSFLSPHLWKYTMSYSGGWLRYCPLMLLSFLGLLPFYFKKTNRVLVPLFALLSLYIVASWDVWDYGGAAGRAMVQYYPVLVLPLAALIEFVEQRKFLKIAFYAFAFLSVYLNIWWHYNAHNDGVQVIGASRAYYWKMVGRWSANEENTKLLDNPNVFEGTPQQPILIFDNKFDKTKNTRLEANKNGQDMVILSVDKPENSKKWFRATARFVCTQKEWDVWRQPQFAIRFYDGANVVRTNAIRVHRFLENGEEKSIWVDALPPEQKNWDKIEVLMLYHGSSEILFLENFKFEMFDF